MREEYTLVELGEITELAEGAEFLLEVTEPAFHESILPGAGFCRTG